MKKKLITEPVFETYCWLVWDCTEQELKGWIKKQWNHNIKLTEAAGKMVYIEKGDTVDWIVWLRDNYFKEVVHEATHLTFSFMRFKEIPIDFKTEEVFTHLQGFYIGKMLEAIEGKKK